MQLIYLLTNNYYTSHKISCYCFSGDTASELRILDRKLFNFEKDTGEYLVCRAHWRLSEGGVWWDRWGFLVKNGARRKYTIIVLSNLTYCEDHFHFDIFIRSSKYESFHVFPLTFLCQEGFTVISPPSNSPPRSQLAANQLATSC